MLELVRGRGESVSSVRMQTEVGATPSAFVTQEAVVVLVEDAVLTEPVDIPDGARGTCTRRAGARGGVSAHQSSMPHDGDALAMRWPCPRRGGAQGNSQFGSSPSPTGVRSSGSRPSQ